MYFEKNSGHLLAPKFVRCPHFGGEECYEVGTMVRPPILALVL